MGLFNKFTDRIQAASNKGSSSQSTFHIDPAPAAPPLGPDSIIRYRKQRGINLGAWFVLERWIAEQPFRNASKPGQSDFDVAKGKDAKAVLEEHWDIWIMDEDWAWIKERGFNSVRLPIGYYHLCSVIPEVLKDTDFEPFADVFQGAWQRIEKAIQTAQSFGLGVLVDLHAAAGAQNGDAHSGLSRGKADIFNRSANLRSTSLALRYLASYLAPISHVVGLQLLNEPANDRRLQGWYDSTFDEIRSITGPHFPLYIHDAWDTQHYAGYVGNRSDFVVLDHHLYRCFTSEDNAMTGEQHGQKLRHEFSGTFAGQSGAARGNLVVGEWSAALSDWDKGMPDGERDRNKREFVRAQLELYDQHAAGWWFWTYKKGDGWDAGWCAKDATTAEILPKWVGSRNFRGPPPQDLKDRELKQGQDAHSGYWSANGGSPNPQVFSPGFSQGWDDAVLFMSHPQGVSEMGFVTRWADRRKEDFERAHHPLGDAAWEWEHGFKQGVEACQRVALG